MIIWITGNTGAGKTTLAKQMAGKKTVILDGDDMRNVWNDLGLSKKDRTEQNFRVARLAKIIEDQNHTVIVSVICPYEKVRREIETMTGCLFIYITGGKIGKKYPYEIPRNPLITVDGNTSWLPE